MIWLGWVIDGEDMSTVCPGVGGLGFDWSWGLRLGGPTIGAKIYVAGVLDFWGASTLFKERRRFALILAFNVFVFGKNVL